MQRKAANWEKVFKNHIFNKNIFGLYKAVKNPAVKILKDQIRTQAKDINRHFTAKIMQMANKHMK